MRGQLLSTPPATFPVRSRFPSRISSSGCISCRNRSHTSLTVAGRTAFTPVRPRRNCAPQAGAPDALPTACPNGNWPASRSNSVPNRELGKPAMTTLVMSGRGSEVRLGLRANAAQFSLLVLVNAFVGAMVGLERSILPAIAEQDFHLAARTALLSFIMLFGIAKAITNYGAGRLSDRFGRRHVLVAGWLVAVPVPFLLMWATTWTWVLIANVFLGISQGLT